MTDPLTDRQRAFIDGLCRQLHIAEVTALVRCPAILADPENARQLGAGELTKSAASELIEWLVSIRDGQTPLPAPPGQTSMFADGGLR